jgi:hypothetical protein
MTKKQVGFILGLAAAAGVYWWYTSKAPQFKVIEFDAESKNVKWQYGSLTNISQAGQNNTYSSSPNSDFYVNVSPIEENNKVIGVRFSFLGKDQREPQFVYFN